MRRKQEGDQKEEKEKRECKWMTKELQRERNGIQLEHKKKNFEEIPAYSFQVKLFNFEC